MKCETQESKAGYTKHLNLYYPKKYMCKYRVNQYLIVLNLCSTSVNKILIMGLVTVKVSQNLSST